MSNFRMIYDNAANRATLTASSSAGAQLGVANLLTDRKGEVWRSTGLAAWLSATWSSAEQVSGIMLPFCNLTAAAMVRVRASTELSTANLLSHSQNFSDASWSKHGSLSADVAQAPDGTNTADRLSGDNLDGYVRQTSTAQNGATYTASVWLRADASASCNLYLFTSQTNSTGKTVQVGTNWERHTISLTTDQAGNLSAQFGGGGGLANKQIYLWGAQLEIGATATSYYPTGASAAVRPTGYTDAWQTYAYDSGWVPACPGWEGESGVNAYSYTGGPCARLWMPQIACTGLAIYLDDSTNPAGYLEAGRLVCGRYWEGDKNVDYNAALTVVDRTELSRTDGGDLVADVAGKHRKITFSLSNMNLSDRNNLWNVLWNNGKRRPIGFSMLPETGLEQQHMMYCRLVTSPAMSLPSFMQYAASLELEEI